MTGYLEIEGKLNVAVDSRMRLGPIFFIFMRFDPVADLRGGYDRRAPLRIQILSISCSFGENLAKSYAGAPPEGWRPHVGEILDPPLVCGKKV